MAMHEDIVKKVVADDDNGSPCEYCKKRELQ